MICINNKETARKRKEKIIEDERIRTAKQKSDNQLVVQIVTETRAGKYPAEQYATTRSREIKKWFEARRI